MSRERDPTVQRLLSKLALPGIGSSEEDIRPRPETRPVRNSVQTLDSSKSTISTGLRILSRGQEAKEKTRRPECGKAESWAESYAVV